MTAEKGNIVFNNTFKAQNGATVFLNGKTEFKDNVEVTHKASQPIPGAYSSVVVEELGSTIKNATIEGYRNTAFSNGSALQIKKGLEHGGNFTVKTNGFLILGDTISAYDPNSPQDLNKIFIDAATYLHNNVEGMDKYSINVIDANYYQSGAVISSPINLNNTTINLIASSTNFNGGKPNTPSPQANGLYVAKQNFLVADFTNIGKNNATEDKNVLIDNTGKKQVKFENGSGLHIIGMTQTKDGEYYTLIKGGVTESDFKQATDTNKDGKIDIDSGVYVSSNALFNISTEVKDNNLIAHATYNEKNEVTNNLSPSLGSLIANHYKNGGKDTNPFVSEVLNSPSLKNSQRVKALEGAARAVLISGAPQQAVNIATDTANYINSRTSFTPSVKNAASINQNGQQTNIAAGDNMANGANLWIMPMYQHQKADDLKSGNYSVGYKSNFGGVVLGADYTWANSLRLGASVNMGKGSAESTGKLAKTENDFESLGGGIYIGHTTNNFGLSADVSYTNVNNEIKQNNIAGMLTGDFDTHVINSGVRAEYKYKTNNNVNIVPYVGARYNHIKTDKVDIKMAGRNISSAKSTEADIWQFPVGVAVSKEIKTTSGWNVKPTVDLSIIPVAGDKKITQDISFTGINGSSTLESEIMDKVSGRAKVGVEVSKNNFFMNLDYAYQGSSKMDSHNVQANFGFRF